MSAFNLFLILRFFLFVNVDIFLFSSSDLSIFLMLPPFDETSNGLMVSWKLSNQLFQDFNQTWTQLLFINSPSQIKSIQNFWNPFLGYCSIQTKRWIKIYIVCYLIYRHNISLYSWQLMSEFDLNQYTGWFFWLVPPRKVLSMELVPPKREKWLSLPKMAKIPTKKVKVQLRVCPAFTLCCNLAEKIKVWQLWLGLSLF